MEINPNVKPGRVEPAQPARPANRPTKVAEDLAAFGESDALEQALQKVPDQRVEMIRKAMDLVGDPTYPPRETIRKIAQLLAMRLPEDEQF